MIRALARRLAHDSNNMPAPDPACRVYDFAGAVVLHRNHARQVEMSAGYHNTHDPMDWDEFSTDPSGSQLTYADLSGGW